MIVLDLLRNRAPILKMHRTCLLGVALRHPRLMPEARHLEPIVSSTGGAGFMHLPDARHLWIEVLMAA